MCGWDLLSALSLAIAFAGDHGDLRVVGQAVEGGGGEKSVAEEIGLFRRGAVAGHEDAACLVAWDRRSASSLWP